MKRDQDSSPPAGRPRRRPTESAIGENGRADRPRQGLLSSSLVGSTNRERVLQALFDLGPTSRAELARQAGVNRTTISGIVQPLIDQGFLVEGEPLPAGEEGGKRARPLWFSPDTQPICGVLLMPDLVHACLVTMEGKITAEHDRKLVQATSRQDETVAVITDCIARTLAQASRPPLGIGIAVGGMVDTDHGSIVAMNLAPALNGLQLGDELTRKFNLPILLDHHPRALLVGDRWFGQGRGVRTFAVVYTGEVMGGALYLDGHLYRGLAGAGGELGHTFVQVDGDLCRCGRRGCWDTIATLSWLRTEGRKVGLTDPDLNSRRLVQLVDGGNRAAAGLLDRYARNVAVGIANLQQTLAPNFFILHGDVVGGGQRMMDAIAAHARQLVPAHPRNAITLAAGESEDRAALLGAAGLVLSDLLQVPI